MKVTETISYGEGKFKEFPVERMGETKKKSFASKLGTFCANVILLAITIGITTAVMALVAKFIMWLF